MTQLKITETSSRWLGSLLIHTKSGICVRRHAKKLSTKPLKVELSLLQSFGVTGTETCQDLIEALGSHTVGTGVS